VSPSPSSFSQSSCISGSFATVYRGYHQVSNTTYRFSRYLSGNPAAPSASFDGLLTSLVVQDTRAAVAIKTISRTILTPKLIDNLESEISILKQLKHKHITQLIDILKVERFIFLIMEDCTGGDLAGYLKRRGRVEGLQYIPGPGQAPIYYPHPRSGGLDIVVVRSFLRQLGEPELAFSVNTCSPRSAGGIECHVALC
jgi:serine/threonine protein kinase